MVGAALVVGGADVAARAQHAVPDTGGKGDGEVKDKQNRRGRALAADSAHMLYTAWKLL